MAQKIPRKGYLKRYLATLPGIQAYNLVQLKMEIVQAAKFLQRINYYQILRSLQIQTLTK